MKKFAFVLALSFVVAGISAASTPVSFSPATGFLAGPVTRDVCWDEAANLQGTKISSEIIGVYGLESELANDFMIAGSTTVTKATATGGYYNWAPGDPDVTAYNVRFYDDVGCFPGPVVGSVLGDAGTVTFIGYDGYGYPTYTIAVNTSQAVTGGYIYWLGFQAADHVFPPQWGRQQSVSVTNCDTMFKSAFFGYPDWIPAGNLIGAPFDAAQTLECGGVNATVATTWGTIKGLYR